MPPRKNVTHHVQHGKKRNQEDSMQSERFLENLKNHIPEKAVPLIWPLIAEYDFALTVTKERKTKHGDYRAPMSSGQPHRISVNGSLNPYAFLLTFIHEVAHMHAFEKYGRRIMPHGKEWKRIFRNIAKPFLQDGVWPEDITLVLTKHFVNPKASSAGDIALTRVLRKYDDNADIYLEDLEEGTYFAVSSEDGRQFVKGKKRRTRYLCTELKTNKIFTIHGMAKVYIIQ